MAEELLIKWQFIESPDWNKKKPKEISKFFEQEEVKDLLKGVKNPAFTEEELTGREVGDTRVNLDTYLEGELESYKQFLNTSATEFYEKQYEQSSFISRIRLFKKRISPEETFNREEHREYVIEQRERTLIENRITMTEAELGWWNERFEELTDLKEGLEATPKWYHFWSRLRADERKRQAKKIGTLLGKIGHYVLLIGGRASLLKEEKQEREARSLERLKIGYLHTEIQKLKCHNPLIWRIARSEAGKKLAKLQKALLEQQLQLPVAIVIEEALQQPEPEENRPRRALSSSTIPTIEETVERPSSRYSQGTRISV